MKKKINIALILIVLTVWGLVASKTLKQYFFLDKKTNHSKNYNSNLKINQINKDTFSINHIDRDPFLNKESRIITSSLAPKTHFKSPIIKKKLKPELIKNVEILNWPVISYHGYINSKDRKDELLLLVNIDKKLHKLKLNEESEGITVKKIYKDSIEIDFNSEKKIFRLN
ncbi:hypothetical protein [Flavobacterium sp. N3904]|uniref:hypothetical protein n=1 Tax=Flavobacterium sp. N3904 TaxID=2986835 RepID=UPI002225309F|nr:hypothetical protein [Flavobacterium sp. N3904]